MGQLEEATAGVRKSLTIAVMGCAVNGPGEAREADLGVACARGAGFLYKRGEKIAKVQENEIVPELLRIINDWED
jgi:(E)-4-hydroxy-3-methylbut-2-enyl-diphosphate synthase